MPACCWARFGPHHFCHTCVVQLDLPGHAGSTAQDVPQKAIQCG
jgi:hypothetical protein